jgi:3-oxoacyl-[acyl-carrier-protein] synthase II
MSRRVVVTGFSVVSSIGVGAQENWGALVEGRSGVDKITRFDAQDFKTQFAAEVKSFDVERFIPAKEARTMDYFIHYAIAAGQMAYDAAGLSSLDELEKQRVATIIGCGLGGLNEMEDGKKTIMERGPSRLSPFFIPKLISNLAAGHLAIRFGFGGPSFCTTSACSSGAHAIGEAFRMIKNNIIDRALTGGTESTISALCIAGFNAMRALSTRNDHPQKASRPFDKDRDGFVVGEGAGLLVLEELEIAKKRGAKIYAEVLGYGANCDAYHMTAPSPEGKGAAEAMSLALKEAEIDKEKILAINAHGTSTGLGDVAETQAIKKVFGDHAYKIKVSSTKSMVGHTLGAAGGIESVYTIQALEHQVVPPTINLDQPDPECDLDYVPHHAQDWKHEYALSNSFGFGGTNASLIFKRFVD